MTPATYTGSLEGVVCISDVCPPDASRMACQVGGGLPGGEARGGGIGGA